MPSTRKQKARSKEMDMLLNYGIMDVLLGTESANPFERELANTINGSASHNDTETFFQQKKSSSKEMNLEILAVELHFLGKTGSSSLWRRSQMKEKCVWTFNVHDALSDQKHQKFCYQ